MTETYSYGVRIEAGALVDTYYVHAKDHTDAQAKACAEFTGEVGERTALAGEVTGCEQLLVGQRASWDTARG